MLRWAVMAAFAHASRSSCILTVLACLVSLGGCRGRDGDGDGPPSPPEGDGLSFAEEGVDTSAAESDAQLLTASLVSASATGIGLASVDLASGDLGTNDVGDGAKAIYFPRSCLTVAHDAATQTVAYTFAGCIGPNGLFGITGAVSARYSVSAEQLHLEIAADDLTINGATVDWTATADITSTSAERTMTWRAELAGISAGKRAFTRTNEHTIRWRLGDRCVEVSGMSNGTIRRGDPPSDAGREIRTEISDFRRCGRGCPEADGKITVTNVSTNTSVELRYDGTNLATFVGANGREMTVRMLCRS